ncbi:MAG: pyridoxamine 5'-phosphate oxidase [Pyrinomonas sp.]|uniref:pyridoxamine 5'-phosphate oxidase n=1 Tax=Pyrinomonas sp. TaxID=2080306 RepID=UPI00331E6BB9
MSVKEILFSIRRDYSGKPLDERSVLRDPLKQLEAWLKEAVESEALEPNAMILATSSPEGAPSARAVLVRGLDERGLVFYTNYRSRKAQEIFANPRASGLFFWPELNRQVRIEGAVERVSAEESDAYFRSRPRDSQIAAWASEQSAPVESRQALEEAFAKMKASFGSGDVPRPPFWGGFRLVPARFEFWQGRENRLHDRILYLKEGDSWIIKRLAP